VREIERKGGKEGGRNGGRERGREGERETHIKDTCMLVEVIFRCNTQPVV